MLKQIIPKNKTRLSELIREQTDLGHFQIQKIISGKSVKINGQRVNQDVVLKGDETVYIYIKDREYKPKFLHNGINKLMCLINSQLNHLHFACRKLVLTQC